MAAEDKDHGKRPQHLAVDNAQELAMLAQKLGMEIRIWSLFYVVFPWPRSPRAIFPLLVAQGAAGEAYVSDGDE